MNEVSIQTALNEQGEPAVILRFGDVGMLLDTDKARAFGALVIGAAASADLQAILFEKLGSSADGLIELFRSTDDKRSTSSPKLDGTAKD